MVVPEAANMAGRKDAVKSESRPSVYVSTNASATQGRSNDKNNNE